MSVRMSLFSMGVKCSLAVIVYTAGVNSNHLSKIEMYGKIS